MISKELLSEILQIKNIFGEIKEKDNQIIFRFRYGKPITNATYFINIYELAHKCKEWAYNKGYILESGIDGNISYCKVLKEKEEIDIFYELDNEYKAIFKACKWILKEKL